MSQEQGQEQPQQDSWETTEVFNFLSHEAMWPTEPNRHDSLEYTADCLKAELLGDEKDTTYKPIWDSFLENGGSTKEINWLRLAALCKADVIGDDWELKVELTLEPIQGRDKGHLVELLEEIINDIHKGETYIKGKLSIDEI